MTIYRLYTHNGNRAALLGPATEVGPTPAPRIQSIAGQRLGRPPAAGPLYDNAEVIVRGFDVRSGRPVTAAAAGWNSRTDQKNAALICQTMVAS